MILLTTGDKVLRKRIVREWRSSDRICSEGLYFSGDFAWEKEVLRLSHANLWGEQDVGVFRHREDGLCDGWGWRESGRWGQCLNRRSQLDQRHSDLLSESFLSLLAPTVEPCEFWRTEMRKPRYGSRKSHFQGHTVYKYKSTAKPDVDFYLLLIHPSATMC